MGEAVEIPSDGVWWRKRDVSVIRACSIRGNIIRAALRGIARGNPRDAVALILVARKIRDCTR